MARVKISEFKAKKLLSESTGFPFSSVSVKFPINDKDIQFDPKKSYVVKVDQGVKKRFKKGLVELGVSGNEVEKSVEKLAGKGFSQFIVEPFVTYPPGSERYLSFERIREGIRVAYSVQGGVDIEDHPESVESVVVKHKADLHVVAQTLGLKPAILEGILDAFEKYYFSFLEINPLVVDGENIYFLDAACEVDSCAEFFVNGAWSEGDFVDAIGQNLTEEENNVVHLASQSTAAFMLKVINPDAALFLLLNSGGSSIVIADEIFDKGYGKEIGNFGENSGSPTTEEAYIYSKNILSLLLKSAQKKKALVVGGGVANFTDVRTTFRGVIQALEEVKGDLRKQKVTVFVRRGGPSQEEGLQLMREFLERENLFGAVYGPEVVLTKIVGDAIEYLKTDKSLKLKD